MYHTLTHPLFKPDAMVHSSFSGLLVHDPKHANLNTINTSELSTGSDNTIIHMVSAISCGAPDTIQLGVQNVLSQLEVSAQGNIALRAK